MIVMKFGGTSVGSRERVHHVAGLIANQEGPVAVVVSAMGKTTDRLLDAARLAERGRLDDSRDVVSAIRDAHHHAVDDPEAHRRLDALFEELASILRGVSLLRELTPRSQALVMSFGERLSVEVVAAHVVARGRSARPVDARDLVVTDDRWLDARVEQEMTFQRVSTQLVPVIEDGVVPIVTGFIAATPSGVTTTLGRSGSDYTASLLGSLLQAREVWIWTDVDGILTADPRMVKEARTLKQVSYREAAEMSFFGARVVHPKTMLPAITHGIPIRIRSTFDPEGEGTLITDKSGESVDGVKTVTSINDLAIVTVDGRGMTGVPGFSRRIFQTTEDAQVNVMMISQASSEQTVSLAVGTEDAERLASHLRECFSIELRAGVIERIAVRDRVSVISIIGQGMAGTHGVAGKLFGALGRIGVNVLAIAQGASELSISVAIDQSDVVRGVRAVHTAFGLTRIVHLFLLGAGRVGQSLLKMLADTREIHTGDLKVDLRLVGLASSRRWLLDEHGLDPLTAATALEEDGEERPEDDEILDALQESRFSDVVVVDVTAADLSSMHRGALERGFHMVTANKVPLSVSLEIYRALVAARQRTGARYGYETTFGAGLPVLHALKELLHTGDTLHSVEGCFSGTLGFVSTRLEEGKPLPDVVAEAQDLGYTEPDPREDLSGRDVARKALIIARAMGLDLEPDDVELQPLVPGLEEGLDPALQAYAEPVKAELAAAAERGEVLRYVASITPERVEVGMKAVPADSPIGSLRGPDNILVFRTERYHDYPLVIRGPGAGAEVTAAGVLGDILKIAT